jgi:hypothetical protein
MVCRLVNQLKIKILIIICFCIEKKNLKNEKNDFFYEITNINPFLLQIDTYKIIEGTYGTLVSLKTTNVVHGQLHKI